MSNEDPTTPPKLPDVAGEPGGPVSAGAQLSGQQQALFQALARKDERLAQMYYGALMALEDSRNPEAIPQAAHSMRELMDQLPKYWSLPQRATAQSLKPQVQRLHERWDRTQKRSRCHDRGEWRDEVDDVLKDFLGHVGMFFEWFASHAPKRAHEAAMTLRRLDRSVRNLPPVIEDLNVKQWQETREAFIKVAHHSRAIERDQLLTWIDSFERFLLDRLLPRTFETLTDIDEIIELGDAER